MLSINLIKALSKVYKYENSEYDFDKKIKTYNIPDKLTAKQQKILSESNFELNTIKQYKHDDVVKQLKRISKNDKLEQIVSNLFIKAVASGLHRGIQPIFSYYFSKHMPEHTYELFNREGFRPDNTCKVCGMKETMWQNDSENIYHLYTGYAKLGGYTEMLLDLEEVMTFDEIIASNDEKEQFLSVMKIIENTPKDETPSALIKRLAKEKCLPGSNLTSRTWLVKCLAELGVLQNEYDKDYSIIHKFVPYHEKFEWAIDIHNNSPARADVEFPISAWRGKLGVNRNIIDQIIANAKA